MSDAIATTKDFQTRMFERIRDQMGEMLTDDDMRKIIEQAVQKAFFEPQRITRQYGADEVRPAAFVAMVKDAAKPMIQGAVNKWVADNQDSLAEKIDGIIRDGITGIVMQHINYAMSVPFNSIQMELQKLGAHR